MRSYDVRGRAASTAGADAPALYEAALASFHGHRGDVAERVNAALACDPGLVAAHTLRVAALVLAGGAPPNAALAAALDALEGVAGRADDRASRHAAAARAWLDGDVRRALELYGALVVDYPRDSVALQVAHALDFRLGYREMLRDRVAAVLPHWDASVPGYGHVLAMYAFGLEEAGDYEHAEATAKEALRLEPASASAVHVVAHVLEMQGRAHEGVAWLEATRAVWDGNAGFSTHVAWHLGLFKVDLDAVPAALTIYDDTLAPRAAASLSALIDATALLWRLGLCGLDLRVRWRELARHWVYVPLRGERVFTLVHALLAFAAGGDARRAVRVACLLRHDRATRAANSAQDVVLAIPLAEGFLAFGRGDYGVAVDRIAAARAMAYRCGGSLAQCDLIHLTLTEAALRAQRARFAEALAAERTARKPASPLNRWLTARAREACAA